MGLVRTYSLEESFLSRLEVPEDYLSEANVEFAQLRKKRPIEFPIVFIISRRRVSTDNSNYEQGQ